MCMSDTVVGNVVHVYGREVAQQPSRERSTHVVDGSLA